MTIARDSIRYIIFEVIKHIYDANVFYNYALVSKMCLEACKLMINSPLFIYRFTKLRKNGTFGFNHILPNGGKHGWGGYNTTPGPLNYVFRM